MNETVLQMRDFLIGASNRKFQLETIDRDIDFSGDDVCTPHLHHGLEIKVLDDFQTKVAQISKEPLPPLRMVIVPSRIVHAVSQAHKSISILIENNKISGDYNHKILPMSFSPAVFADCGLMIPGIVKFLEMGILSGNFTTSFPLHMENIIQALFSAFIEILEKFSEQEPNSLVKCAVDFINRNYYRHDFFVEDVATYLGITSNYLSWIFRKETGHTVRQQLIITRLKQAELLLRSGRCLVKDAARLTGWNSAYYFSNSFHKYFGFPPSEISPSQCSQ